MCMLAFTTKRLNKLSLDIAVFHVNECLLKNRC